MIYLAIPVAVLLFSALCRRRGRHGRSMLYHSAVALRAGLRLVGNWSVAVASGIEAIVTGASEVFREAFWREWKPRKKAKPVIMKSKAVGQ
jgi:hypothetical protein